MQGIYKTRLSEKQLRDAAMATFGRPLLAFEEMTDGWANSAFKLELDDGRKAVLKARPSSELRFMRCEIDLMKTDVEAMGRFADTAGVPVPRIYVYDTSRERLPVDYFVMEFVEGEPLNRIRDELDEETRASIYRQLGQINRRINEVQGSGFGFYSGKLERSWPEAFYGMIAGILADGRDAGVELPMAYPELEKRIGDSLALLEEIGEPKLLHWDLWDGNVFVKDGQVTGIVDFERAIWGDPLMEFYFSHFHNSEAFRQGYGITIPDPAQIARRKLYDLYLDLILYVECAYRQYDDRNHVRWAHDNLVRSLERFSAE
ncbi:phosphotransferase family protein [Cohnella sp.]|uniref:phosphotransferase family protein n=1 Tax=Cohnella sp. TaxID=1883426 RepID=UPI003564CAEA